MNYQRDRFWNVPEDVIIQLALDLDLPDLLNLCRVSRRFDRNTCRNDIFWMNKSIRDFGRNVTKPFNMSWREFYRQGSVKDVNKLLIDSSRDDKIEFVKIALIRGADVHTENDLALVWARHKGHLEVIKYLVEHGADIHVEDPDDEGDLVAIYNSRFNVIKQFVDLVHYLVEY